MYFLLNIFPSTVGQVTPTMLAHIGYGTFVFFGVSSEHHVSYPHSFSLAGSMQLWSFLGGMFYLIFVRYSFRLTSLLKVLTGDVQVPETKGLTLEEMDEVFGDSAGTALADQQRHADISRRLGIDKIGQGQADVFNHDDNSSHKEKV